MAVRARRPSWAILALAAVVLAPADPVGADEGPDGDADAQPCEVVVVRLVVNTTTFPPHVQPQLWVRPDCVHV